MAGLSRGRRGLLQMMAASGAMLALPRMAGAAAPADYDWARREIEKRHDESIKRIQTWIHTPSIAAENRNYPQGTQLTMELFKEAGFQGVQMVPTDGKPGVFGYIDAGAARTVGLYFMYDVKQFDPAEWSSPPLEGAVVDKPGLGKAIVGRGAVNQKGPEGAFLAALNAMRGVGRKPPVNLVLVAEGEEEIGSPHFGQIVRRPDILAALRKCNSVYMPAAGQSPEGAVDITLGAKGIIELELVSTGARWGRGPAKDVHSSLKAMLDSPAWHLVLALNTLVADGGNTPAIEGIFEHVRPLSDHEKAMIAKQAGEPGAEAAMKKGLGVQRFIDDLEFRRALERLASQPTVNIEGLVAGYTGPGGKTILPGRAVAKMDLRLVPNMTAAEAEAKLKAHLAKHGFGDIEVNVTGGYDPTETPEDSALIRASQAVYRRAGVEIDMSPRGAGSWPGYIFTGDPLHLPAGHFGLGHGSGAHAPNEYYVVESANPKVAGIDGAALSHVQFLHELATIK
ncbi:M20/M25/M40 family metallo-hydrolase [Phenylobacterium sp.]|uniref:M20/M25/M40 family metallo-hydrolase n=1 Tax=Phenylobacterium sp. TaxID=1871053 RepID=UPI002DED2DC2|nr:M20/M25/M40 family metallo-hydrolase [Phenylobacterium sp.]